MDEANKEYQDSHVPVVIGNYAPFRLVLRESDTWKPTLEDVNRNTYNYVKLARLSAFIDVGIAPFSLGVAFDGSLILPALPQYNTRQKAVEAFNDILGKLLLGGIYSEALQPADISSGSLFLKGYVKHHSGGTGQHAKFHSAIKSQHSGISERIALLRPQTIGVEKMKTAYCLGDKYIKALRNLSANLYLNGVSNYVKQQWIEALLFLWTAIEQVVNIMWEDKVVHPAKHSTEKVLGRSTFLNDFRTWTTATKVELLFQKEVIEIVDYQLANLSRKTRNEFIHNGKPVTEEKVEAALDCLFRLMSWVITDYKRSTDLIETLEVVKNNQRGDLYPQDTDLPIQNVSHWLALPDLPGDINWGSKDYEVIDELVLQRIDGGK